MNEECEVCKQRFWSPISRESHKKLYPSHFTGEKHASSTKEDAVLVDLKSKRKKPKREDLAATK
jgi:hypothetical protein